MRRLPHAGRLALAAARLAAATTIAAADYPERRIQHVYPWSPGTPTYAVSQIIADKMGEHLGDPDAGGRDRDLLPSVADPTRQSRLRAVGVYRSSTFVR